MEQPRILIGVLNRRNPGAISTITRAIMDGLSSSYRFIPHTADRSAASTRLSAFNLLNLLYLLRDYLLWVARLVRYRPDIAHYPVTSYWNLEKSLLFLGTARLLGARNIGHLHGGAFIEFWNGLGSSRRNRSLKQLRRLDAFVVLSEGWRNMVRDEVGIEEERLQVVYNPLDPEFEREAIAMPTGRSGGTILSIGGIGKLKGLFDIVEAGRLCGARTGFHFVLAGPEREPHAVREARERIDRYQLADFMELRGGAWGEEKTGLFQGAAMFVLPSYYENLPLVILEAAAAGLPIISTPVGALPEFFTHGESILFVQPGDVRRLADSLAELMENPGRRRELGSAARNVYLDFFSRERIMDSLAHVYEKVLGHAIHTK